MDLAFRFILLVITTALLTLTSIVVLLGDHRFQFFRRFNHEFLGLLGLKVERIPQLRWAINWILSAGIATFSLSIIVNFGDLILFITGQSGIGIDPVVIPLVVGGFILGAFVVIVTLIPILTMPPSAPSGLAIIIVLHLFGFQTSFWFQATLLYAVCIAIGFLGTVLSGYLLLTKYVGSVLLQRLSAQSSSSETPNV